MTLLEVRDVHKSFGKKDVRVHALQGASVAVEEGEMVAVMGKSGSGKSTLLNILGGLTKMEEGEYLYRGKRLNLENGRELIRHRRYEIGFIVQYFALIEDITVFDNVALPLRYQRIPKREIRERVMSALKELGIEEKEKAYPNELSGGQQQRVAIARAVVKRPSLILADEPTGALDEGTEAEVLSIFKKLNDSGIAMVIVTHDSKVADACKRTILLKDGKNASV